jgi:hypothetical protein
MPSGLNQILPRMRVTSDALRISALVGACVTTGYFWRAAFEASPSDHPVSAPLKIVEPTPNPPVRFTVKPKAVVPTAQLAPRRPLVISSLSGPRIVQTPSPSVGPAPPNKPTSPPRAPSPQPGTPTPPVTAPTPTSPAATTPVSPANEPVAAATPPPPVVTQPPAQPPPPTGGDDNGDDGKGGNGGNGGNDGQDKPGWGYGDDNHDHSGPKGGHHG